jgi:N-acetylneuraminic acid mutarotase
MNYRIRVIIISIIILFSHLLIADDWYAAPSLHISRGGATAIVLENYIYVFGGKSFDNKVLNNVERFDLIEGDWDTTAVPNFKYPRFNATSVVLEGKIYLMGGQNGETALKVVEVYDPVQNNWTEVHNLRREREALAGAVFNDRIYAIGGQKDNQSLIDEIEWYDQPADDWLDAIFDLPYPRAAHFYSVLGDTFYMFGGYYYGPTRTTYKAIPGDSEYEWVQLDDLEIGRAYGAATISRGDIYIIGGETSSGKTNTVEVFLTESETYGHCEPITSPRSGMAAVTIDDSIIYAIGGFETEYNDPVSTVEWYEGELYTAIEDIQNTILPGDHILINGYPNPFNNSIRLEISIPENGDYVMDIYNITGQKVNTLYQGNLKKGYHSYRWQVDSHISSGLYVMIVKSNKYFQKYKMIYVK